MCYQVLQPAGGCLDAIYECSVILNMGVGGRAMGRVAPHTRQTATNVLVKAEGRKDSCCFG